MAKYHDQWEGHYEPDQVCQAEPFYLMNRLHNEQVSFVVWRYTFYGFFAVI